MKRKTQILIRETLNLIKIHSRHVNCIRLHNSTTKEHMNKICEICIWALKNDHHFVTEAEFISGGRADIVFLEQQVAVEVLKTETLKSFKANKSKYPIMAIAIGVDDEWKGL